MYPSEASTQYTAPPPAPAPATAVATTTQQQRGTAQPVSQQSSVFTQVRPLIIITF